jgi:hypothetical protein
MVSTSMVIHGCCCSRCCKKSMASFVETELHHLLGVAVKNCLTFQLVPRASFWHSSLERPVNIKIRFCGQGSDCTYSSPTRIAPARTGSHKVASSGCPLMRSFRRRRRQRRGRKRGHGDRDNALSLERARTYRPGLPAKDPRIVSS